MKMVNYPNQKKTFHRQKESQSNRGMKFEQLLNETNEYYRLHNIAIIHKKPIPIQIVKVDYPSRSAAVIKEAYYKVPSTTDYNGIYKGYYIDFEAKETKNKTSFPLSNIHPHQIEHLNHVMDHGGISFIILYLRIADQVFLLPTKELLVFTKRAIKGRKSISFEELRKVAYEIPQSFAPRIPYLKIVDALIAQKKG
jgi:recombination protein U